MKPQQNFSLKNISLGLFILSFFVGAYCLATNNEILLSFSKVLGTLFITVYYVTSVKKVNYFYISILILIALAGYFFSFDNSSVLGFILVALYRTVLLYLIYLYFRQKDVSFFILIFTGFSIVTFFILSQIFQNKLLFYVIAYIAFLLITMFSLLLVKLIHVNKSSVLEMFLGITIFIISDVIFSLNPLKNLGFYKFIFISFLYHISYFLITSAMIKKDEKRKIPSR